MIVVDANYFLRAMTSNDPKANPAHVAQAQALFRAADAGTVEYTTSEAVIAEVVFVLAKQYGFDRAFIARILVQALELRGCRMATGRTCVAALHLWATHSSLDLADALVAVQAERSGAELATFDRRLARVTSAPIWSPDDSTS